MAAQNMAAQKSAKRKASIQLWILAIILLGSAILFMTVNVRANWDFILPFRGKKLLMLLVAGYAIGVSTMLFQSLTHNPILTPSILGFDALYILLQTVLVFSLGALGYTQLNDILKFTTESLLMIAASVLLFALLLRNKNLNHQDELARMILVGVIFGVLFRSLSQLLQRLLDPMEFAVVQASVFADFTLVKSPMIWIALVVAGISGIGIWRLRFVLDVIALGQQTAISLGMEYRKISLIVLVWIAVLLAASTALVGPVSFFGLLVCALTNMLAPSISHATRLPMVFFIAAITLVLGQTIFEHFLGMKAVLSVVIEFAGGMLFLWLMTRKQKGEH